MKGVERHTRYGQNTTSRGSAQTSQVQRSVFTVTERRGPNIVLG